MHLCPSPAVLAYFLGIFFNSVPPPSFVGRKYLPVAQCEAQVGNSEFREALLLHSGSHLHDAVCQSPDESIDRRGGVQFRPVHLRPILQVNHIRTELHTEALHDTELAE